MNYCAFSLPLDKINVRAKSFFLDHGGMYVLSTVVFDNVWEFTDLHIGSIYLYADEYLAK